MLCKKYLGYPRILARYRTTSRTELYSCGIVLLNETVVYALLFFTYLYFLLLNQSGSTIKKIAEINGMLLDKTDVHSFPPKNLVYLKMVKIL